MNDPQLPMTAADWSWLFQARPQAPAEAPMQLASAAPAAAPRPPTARPVAAAPAPAPRAPVPLPPPRPADIGTYGAMPSKFAFNDLSINPDSGADAEALMRSRMPSYGGLQPPAAPPQSADAQSMMDALLKRGQVSPDILAKLLAGL